MLADAKTFLKNKKISLDDPSFVEIRNMLGNKLKYCYLFTFMHYEKCVQLDDLKLLLNDFTVLKDHLHLIKDVTTYRDPKELSRDLNDLKKQVANKKFFDAMPKILKESIVELLIGETSGDKKYANRYFNSTYDFYKLKENYQKDFTKNVSRINTAKSLISSLDAYIKLVKQGRDIETIRSLYPTVYGCKLVHDENNVLILEVFERDAMKKLGTTQWCIARSDSHW